jgi:6-phosphogluconate dehydrogenase
MQLGMIGLGRMGGNIVRRLMRGGHQCVVYDTNAKSVEQLAGEGATGSRDMAHMVSQMPKPRAIWVMLPAGAITEATVTQLGELLEAGDTIIDGGNSNFQDDVRRAQTMAAKGIRYIDVGTSGGVWGLERGYCMMIGGDKPAFDHLDPIFKTLAPGVGTIEKTRGRDNRHSTAEEGYLYTGPAGSGHFPESVHESCGQK